MGNPVDEARARAELTDVRLEQEHWRFSVATFLGGAMALSVLFLARFAQRYEEICEEVWNGCEVVPLFDAAVIGFAGFGALALFSMIRWARRLQFTEEGIWLAVWMIIVGLVAANLDPWLLSNSFAFMGGIWGFAGIALVRQVVKTGSRTRPTWPTESPSFLC